VRGDRREGILEILLTFAKCDEIVVDPIESPFISVTPEDELDGPTLMNVVLQTVDYLPVIAGSAAATLLAVNKSIDEFQSLLKKVFRSSKVDKATAGAFSDGVAVLTPDSSDADIDKYFDNLKEQAKKARVPDATKP
jgi:hypothetical protein